jgi:hypothetical protein
MYSCPFLFLLRFLLIFVLHFACGKYASSLSIVIDFHFFSTELFCRVARILVGAVVCVHFLLVFDDPQQLCVR